MSLCWVTHRKEAVEERYVGSAFWRNEDGSWICIDPITIEHPQGRVQVAPGATFRPGIPYMGVDLALWLDEQIKKVTPPA